MPNDKLKSDVAVCLGENPAAALCLELVDRIEKLPPDRARYLTYTSIQKMVERAEIDQPLILAVSFLTSSRFALLKAFGQFVDDDGEEFPLGDNEFQRLLATGELVHPRTGELVAGAFDKVTPFFALKNEQLDGVQR